MVNFVCIENINDFFDSEAVNVNIKKESFFRNRLHILSPTVEVIKDIMTVDYSP